MNQEEREAWFRYIRLSEDGKVRFKEKLGLVDKLTFQRLEQTLAEILGADIPSSEGVEDE